MSWNAVWGSEKSLKTLNRHYAQTGVMPPALENRPRLLRHQEVYHEAFLILSSGRQNTDHVINPITFSEVMQYCDCAEVFDGYERIRYWIMVNSCDIAFIEAMLQKRATEINNKPLKK